MNHLRRTLAVVAAIVVAAVPAILTTPSFENYITRHPELAAYLPLVSGAVYALYRAWQERSSSSSAR